MSWIKKKLISNALRFILLLGGNYMIFVTISVSLIVAGRRTIDTCPQNLREAILADLFALGLDGYGKPLEVVEPTAQ